MRNDIPKPISQGSDGAQDAENRRIEAVANELDRLCAIYETQSGAGQANVSHFEAEQRATELFAKENGLWIPMEDVLSLGVPGPSGNENDTYVADDAVYKVNNLMNSRGIVALLRKVSMHNILFPDTAYSLHGFAGFDGRTVYPVIKQARIAEAKPATEVMIDMYMSALGFEKVPHTEGRFTNGNYEVWDILPRNVLSDSDGDLFVIDAEIKENR